MNQIIYREVLEDYIGKQKKKRTRFFLFLIFCISIFLIFTFLSYFFLNWNQSRKTNQLAQRLSTQFELAALYSENTIVPNSTIRINDTEVSVIGTISIEKINLYYPILSETTDELLKIAPCYFYGTMPNEMGNLCIAGHNYDNDRFFSKIATLKIGDEIKIKDANNQTFTYQVNSSQEINPTEGESVLSSPPNIRQVTLITCNNRNGNRIIVKAIAP